MTQIHCDITECKQNLSKVYGDRQGQKECMKDEVNLREVTGGSLHVECLEYEA